MKWTRVLCLAAVMTPAVSADELHLRDGTVIVGSYVGGSQKEIWFQKAPSAPEVYPLFLVESLKFNFIPALAPDTAATAPAPGAHAPAHASAVQSGGNVVWVGPVKWGFALFLPPPLTALLAYPAH
jgi:hypothetical protein